MRSKKINMCEFLKYSKTIAVVGISSNPDKTSRAIADFLLRKGYRVVGVHPKPFDIEGIPVYAKLTDIPFDIDIVDVFRRSEMIDEIIPDVLDKNPKALWLQLGIRNDKAVKPVVDNDIFVVQDECIKIVYNSCS